MFPISLDTFNLTLNKSWNMDPLDRQLDDIKINEYLSLMDEPDNSFIRELLNNTIYVPYIKFEEALFKSFYQFKEDIKSEEFYLMLSNKIGSEHWLTALLWPHLKDMNIKNIIDEESELPIKNKYNILILDDAIYTGTNTFNKIDIPTFNVLNKIGAETKNIDIIFYFYIVIPFVSNVGYKFILDECNIRGVKCKFYNIVNIPSLGELVDINKYYPEDSEQILRDKFSISLKLDLPISDMPAIYFDHKVAAPESTFSSVYLRGKLPSLWQISILKKQHKIVVWPKVKYIYHQVVLLTMVQIL
jgi:hypothetical protein